MQDLKGESAHILYCVQGLCGKSLLEIRMLSAQARGASWHGVPSSFHYPHNWWDARCAGQVANTFMSSGRASVGI